MVFVSIVSTLAYILSNQEIPGHGLLIQTMLTVNRKKVTLQYTQSNSLHIWHFKLAHRSLPLLVLVIQGQFITILHMKTITLYCTHTHTHRFKDCLFHKCLFANHVDIRHRKPFDLKASCFFEWGILFIFDMRLLQDWLNYVCVDNDI